MKIFKIVFSSVYWLVIFSLVLIALSSTVSALDISKTYKILIVQSGSMEPKIKTGSMIVIKKLDTYNVGDIITFSSGGDSTTHRVIKSQVTAGREFFSTKGDANQGQDQGAISSEKIMGKTVLIVPYFGSLVSFTKTQKGFIFLIIIPATIIIFSELLNVKKEILGLIKKKEDLLWVKR